jgi:hypothetical protein
MIPSKLPRESLMSGRREVVRQLVYKEQPAVLIGERTLEDAYKSLSRQ